MKVKGRKPGWRRREWALRIVFLLAGVMVFSHLLILLGGLTVKYRTPPIRAMIVRPELASSSKRLRPKRKQLWIPYQKMSPNLVRAVLAGEDSRFYAHSGFDRKEIRNAAERNRKEKRFGRGVSTISQQLAKNLFLSTSENPVRKLHPALISWEMETLPGERPVLELYLNVIERGDGVYGAEAAARHDVEASASSLAAQQAAFLAAIIPNPRGVYNPTTHPRWVERRATLILHRMKQIVIPET